MLSETVFLSQIQSNLSNDDFNNLLVHSNVHDAAKRNLSLHFSTTYTIDREFDTTVNEAIQLKANLSSQEMGTLFSSFEPDILREKFYQHSYPDDDSEFPDFPSWI